jgi:hypothetical protein
MFFLIQGGAMLSVLLGAFIVISLSGVVSTYTGLPTIGMTRSVGVLLLAAGIYVMLAVKHEIKRNFNVTLVMGLCQFFAFFAFMGAVLPIIA